MLKLPDGRPAIISDTVGFISDLPHELVAAFRATLEEVQEADVVAPCARHRQRRDRGPGGRTSAPVLERLGVDMAERRMLEVWNKVDLARTRRPCDGLPATRAGHHPPAVLVSAVTGEGCEALLSAIAGLVDESPPVEAHVPPGGGAAIAWLYRHGRVLDRDAEPDGGVVLAVRLTPRRWASSRSCPQAEVGSRLSPAESPGRALHASPPAGGAAGA